MKKWNVWEILRWGLVALFALSFIRFIAFNSLIARWFVFVFGLAFFTVLILERNAGKKEKEEKEKEESNGEAPDEKKGGNHHVL